ncbi:MAG TPA: hypothetical protein VH081_01320 [Solirubrobacteraceae bacterium]|nr:hypothetical protein [Solirubrobacteraceae bacterium]
MAMKGGVPVAAAFSVRPPRVAVLVPPLAGSDWRPLFESALASQCGLWGGEGNIVLPWDEQRVDDPLFWQLLRCHDPDVLAVYTPSLAELVLIDRDSYETHIALIKSKLDPVEGVEDRERERFLDNQLKETVVKADLGDAFETVRRRMSVLDGPAPLGWLSLQGNALPGYPFTAMQSLGIPETGVVDPVCGLGETARLLLAAHVGRLPPHLRSWLVEEQKVSALPIADLGSWLLAVSDRRRDRGRTYPWDLSRRGLAWYDMARGDPQVVVVAGDEPMDFALFYLLRRLNGPAFWMPREGLSTSHLADYNQRVITDIAHAAGQQGSREVLVTSATAPAWCERLAAELPKAMDTPTLLLRAVEPHLTLPEQPVRLFELDGQGRQGELMLDLVGDSRPLPTPIPRRVRSANALDLRWMTDVRLDGWTPMSHHRLAERILGAPHTSVRISDSGASYLCPVHTAFGRENVESVAARPTLHRLDLLEQLRAATKANGWQITPSDKGSYAEQSTILFGGLDELWRSLLDPATRALLDCFGPHAVGRRFRDRRYLPASQMPENVDDELLGRYESSGVIRRGLALKCERCRQADFYELEEVGRSFRCHRCALEQVHAPRHWLGASEPEWHFGLAEVVHQFLQHNGDIPVAATRSLLENSPRPFSVAFELELYDAEGVKSEHDLIITNGSRLMVGEATTADRLEKPRKAELARLERLGSVADLLEAEAIVLATTKAQFAHSSIDRARSVLQRPWRSLEILEGLQHRPA